MRFVRNGERLGMKYDTVKLGDISWINTESYSSKENWIYVNYLDTGNITENMVSEIQHIEIGKQKLPSRAKRKVKYNSIIYSTVRPNQKHYGIIKELPNNFLVSTGFAVIDIDTEKASPDYVYFVLTQESVTEYLHAIAEQSTSAYPSIKPSDLKNIEIRLPSLEDQKRIASILVTLNRKIDINMRINDNLAEQMAAIFINARDSSMWLEQKIENIMCFYDHMRKPLSSRQRNGMERNYPYYGATSIVDYVENYIFDGTYILISEDGANVVDKEGHPLTQYAYGKFWANNHAHIVQGINGFSEALLFALLKTLNIQSIVTGAAQPKVNQANLRNFVTFLPKPDEAEQLAALLEPFFNQMIVNDKVNASLTKLRDTLLPKLMSGELDVSNLDL